MKSVFEFEFQMNNQKGKIDLMKEVECHVFGNEKIMVWHVRHASFSSFVFPISFTVHIYKSISHFLHSSHINLLHRFFFSCISLGRSFNIPPQLRRVNYCLKETVINMYNARCFRLVQFDITLSF